MLFHLVYTIVSEEMQRLPYKVSDQVEFAMQKWSENDIIAVTLWFYALHFSYSKLRLIGFNLTQKNPWIIHITTENDCTRVSSEL